MNRLRERYFVCLEFYSLSKRLINNFKNCQLYDEDRYIIQKLENPDHFFSGNDDDTIRFSLYNR